MDVAASEFYDNKDKTYDLNFKEEVTKLQHIWLHMDNYFFYILIIWIYYLLCWVSWLNYLVLCCRKMMDHKKYQETV